jgi:flagellar hook-length control protein FliK
MTASPGSAAFAPELGATLATFVREGVHHARLELNPAAMGPLTVQIQLDGQAAHVHLAAQNADTRQALEQAMPTLAGSLREAGLTLSGGGVFEQPRQPQPDASSGKGTRGPNDERAGDDERGTSAQPPHAPPRRRGVVDLIA